MEFLFDQILRHRIINDKTAGMEYRRGVLVKDIPIAEGDSDARVFLKVLEDDACPKIDEHLSEDDLQLKVVRHELVNVGRSEKHCMMDVVYQGPTMGQGDPGEGGSAIWTLEDDVVISHINTFATAGGIDLIKLWYKKDAGTATTAEPSAEEGGKYHQSDHATIMRAHRVLRGRSIMTPDTWNTSYRAYFRGLRNKINASTWGTSPRGTWYFPGPKISRNRYIDQIVVELNVLESIDGHFPLIAFFDKFGKHPPDCITEVDLRAEATAGPPAVGETKRGKGLTLASVYLEGDFGSFDFTPDSL